MYSIHPRGVSLHVRNVKRADALEIISSICLTFSKCYNSSSNNTISEAMLFFTRCTINFQNVFVVVTTLTTTTTSPSFCIDLAESPSYQSPVTTDLETMMRTSVPRKRMEEDDDIWAERGCELYCDDQWSWIVCGIVE